jgi:hypothetical protein
METGIKLSLCWNWAPRHEGVLGEWRYSFNHSLTSALDWGEWSASRPARFTHRERAPGTHWIGGLTGPRAVLDAMDDIGIIIIIIIIIIISAVLCHSWSSQHLQKTVDFSTKGIYSRTVPEISTLLCGLGRTVSSTVQHMSSCAYWMFPNYHVMSKISVMWLTETIRQTEALLWY